MINNIKIISKPKSPLNDYPSWERSRLNFIIKL
jgi:hypothetical protein